MNHPVLSLWRGWKERESERGACREEIGRDRRGKGNRICRLRRHAFREKVGTDRFPESRPTSKGQGHEARLTVESHQPPKPFPSSQAETTSHSNSYAFSNAQLSLSLILSDMPLTLLCNSYQPRGQISSALHCDTQWWPRFFSSGKVWWLVTMKINKWQNWIDTGRNILELSEFTPLQRKGWCYWCYSCVHTALLWFIVISLVIIPLKVYNESTLTTFRSHRHCYYVAAQLVHRPPEVVWFRDALVNQHYLLLSRKWGLVLIKWLNGLTLSHHTDDAHTPEIPRSSQFNDQS